MHATHRDKRGKSMAAVARTMATRTRYEPRRWTPTPDEAARYTMGGCWPLAMALHRLTGLPFVAVVEESFSARWGTTEDVVQHVMLRMGRDRYLDVNGMVSWRRFVATLDAEDIDATGWRTIDVDEGFLRSTARESDGEGGRRLSPLRAYPQAPALARRMAATLKLPRKDGTNDGRKERNQ